MSTAAAAGPRTSSSLAGRTWHFGDRDILIVFDAGYDAPRMAHLLDGLPVEVLGRMRSDRVIRRPTPSLKEYAPACPRGRRALDLADHRRAHPDPPSARRRRLAARPWEKPAEPGRLTPARVRRGFRNLRPNLVCPARAPKPSTPGSGRPPGAKNRRPTTRYDVDKTAKRLESITERNRLGS
ncbi:hypothetical protein GCM10010357_45080 [Streptomyces luteireticuli]|uniref:Transposase IS701-like DDE domain-containing protein n=1 Tax=Streptomyces luteireticuli TaxID=173858 RepID=A0ABN0YYE1_9ACTN